MSNESFKLADFDYQLPNNQIAQFPVSPRDASKFLVRQQSGVIEHHFVRDLPKLLSKPSLFIINETKVRPARIPFKLPTGGSAELLLTQLITNKSNDAECAWRAVARPMKKMKAGLELSLDHHMEATILDRVSDMEVNIRFHKSLAEVEEWLNNFGIAPLPPYIQRKSLSSEQRQEDIQRYQTVFAKELGSSAAPTAGLHFTPDLMDRLTQNGHEFAPITLHVGLGTFLPVKTDEIDQHKMHSETYCVPESTLLRIKKARAERTPIICVGTTSLRCLYSFLHPFGGIDGTPVSECNTWRSTDLFLRPQFRQDDPKDVYIDGLMTNFHQPKSTLFMLICALIGFDHAHAMYREALGEKYRFLSYGDSSLLWL